MSTTVDQVAASDTLDAGRIKWNGNDTTLQNAANSLSDQQAAHVGAGHPNLNYTKTEVDSKDSAVQSAVQANVDAVSAALTTHKSSADHDTRYLAASLLTTIMRLTGAQTIDGLKTFLQNIQVQAASPSLEFKYTDGTTLLGKLMFDLATNPILRLMIFDSGNYKSVLEAMGGQTYANFPNHDVAAKGDILATKKYVDQFNASSAGLYKVYSDTGATLPTYQFAGTTPTILLHIAYLHRSIVKHLRLYFEGNLPNDGALISLVGGNNSQNYVGSTTGWSGTFQVDFPTGNNFADGQLYRSASRW